MSKPLISIVVPTLNQASYIEQTLASIFGQGWPRLEVIVVDGGSTDGTQEIVQRYPVAHFISEKDKGQGDAVNKGMRLAQGDILAWLNSDDYYFPLTLERVVAAIPDVRQPHLVYGSCIMIYEGEENARVIYAKPFPVEELDVCCWLYQPSTFWTRPVWEKTGELDLDYYFILDWDYWARAREHAKFTAIPDILSAYLFHGGHKTSNGDPRRVKEVLQHVEHYASPQWTAAYRDVAARLPSMSATWKEHGRKGRYRLHKLRHLDLYLRHGEKVDSAFFQLYV